MQRHINGDPDVTAEVMQEICLRMAATELGFDRPSVLRARDKGRGAGSARIRRASQTPARAAGKARSGTRQQGMAP